MFGPVTAMRNPLDRLLARLAARIAPRVGDQLAAPLLAALERHVNDTLLPEMQRRAEAILTNGIAPRISDQLAAALPAIASDLRAELAKNPLAGSQLYVPGTVVTGSQVAEYMAASTPLTRDFLHPKFAEFALLYGLPFSLHRKHWEWAFIYEQLHRAEMLQQGKRGLGFGVGREMLPALFARMGVTVTATDSPSDDQHWRESAQHAESREGLFAPHILSRELFEERIGFEPCDMTQIPPHLSGFDFCWSSCCFEHLGTLERGLDFVRNSVERTLVVGGIACHTTEFNLSSDEETIEAGRDTIYRKRDLLQLCRTLEERGHTVAPLRIDPGDLVPDYLVDTPPYHHNPHLKLRVGPFVCTSIGLVIRRGR